MSYSFDNQTVVVTGAAGGLGRAVVRYFVKRGSKVACLDISNEVLQQAFADLSSSPDCLMVAVDLTCHDSTAKAIQSVMDRWKTIDVLANIAGGFVMGERVHETSDANWDFLFNLNTRSIIHTTSAVVPLMLKRGKGKIINVSANAAKQGVARMGAYLASKSAVWRLTESMALELRDHHINVNCVLPGIIDTPRNRADMPDADYSKWVAPEKLAQVIGFLASTDAESIHGAAIPVVGLG